LSHPLRSFETTYDVHLGLIGKRVVDFVSVLIGLFSLGVTAESLRERKEIKKSGTRGRHPPIIFELDQPILF